MITVVTTPNPDTFEFDFFDCESEDSDFFDCISDPEEYHNPDPGLKEDIGSGPKDTRAKTWWIRAKTWWTRFTRGDETWYDAEQSFATPKHYQSLVEQGASLLWIGSLLMIIKHPRLLKGLLNCTPLGALAVGILHSGISVPASFSIQLVIGIIAVILTTIVMPILEEIMNESVLLGWIEALIKEGIFIPPGSRRTYRPKLMPPIGYPRVYMVLSCIMWSMAFVAAYTGTSWNGNRYPPESILRRTAIKPIGTNDDALTTRLGRSTELLLAIEQAEASIPAFTLASEAKIRSKMKSDKKPFATVTETTAESPTAFAATVVTTTSPNLRSKLEFLLKNAAFLNLEDTIRIIADTGCSKSSSNDPLDFEGPILPLDKPTFMQGVGNTIEIKGHGTIKWTVINNDGEAQVIRTHGFYVPGMKFRLFSPQAYMQEKGSACDEFSVKKDTATLVWRGGKSKLTVNYDVGTALPIFQAYRDIVGSAETLAANLSVMDTLNQNLSHGQKDALKWHQRLGHIGFQWIQWLARNGFLGSAGNRMVSCEAPLCAACQLARAQKRPTGSKHEQKHPGAGDKIKEGVLFPGQAIATDQYQTRVPGRIPGSFGSTPVASMYTGGTVFVDISTGRAWAFHQVSASSAETMQSKMAFERDCFSHGVGVQAYHGDNGIYSCAEFLRELDTKGQGIQLSGVGAQHQNGVAERAIKTIMDRARTLMLHAAIHWPDERDEQLWPLAVDYSLYLWNNTPKEGHGLSPEELFSGAKSDGTSVLNAHVWGCPVYVLDPALQNDKKLPKWQPKSRRGVFVGVSPNHLSTVGLIRNRTSGYVSPQFHVVYNDWFETVAASADLEPPEWEELVAFSRFRNVLDEGVDSPLLDVDWLTDSEKLARKAGEALRREGRLRQSQPNDRGDNETTATPTPQVNEEEPMRAERDPIPVIPAATDEHSGPLQPPTPVRPAHQTQVPLPTGTTPPRNLGTPDEPPARVTRRGRIIKTPARFANGMTLATIFSCFAAQLGVTSGSSVESYAFMSIHSRLMEPSTGYLDTLHPWSISNPSAFALKPGKHDPDNPTLREARMSEYAEEFGTAMAEEITALEKGNTWTPMLRSSLPSGTNVLPGTWALKIKRFPDGRVRKFKGRYCVRGDKQIKGVDYHETYAPVVAWTTVRMMLVMAATQGLCTTQIDFTNAFVQADIKEDVYIEMPQGFGSPSDGDYILKLNKNLYGLCQAPKSWFDKLATELVALNFKQSVSDPCMFVHDDMTVLVYCDDCLLFGRDQQKIDDMIAEMRIKFPGGITVEDSVFAFLGVELVQDPKTRKTKLSQSGLTKKVLAATKMTDCHAKRTPASAVTLGSNPRGEACCEDWDYASVVGMLMYLSSNSRPDIQFAVHQCARFTYAPRRNHEEAVKHICRYLKGTIHSGIEFDPHPDMALDCYVDADFAGLWGSEDDQDPVCVKSRTGYVLTLGGCPLLWVSRLQTEIALSTLEAEYIALSQAMRDLLPMRRLAKEVAASLGLPADYAATMKSTVFEDNNGALGLATSPKMTPRTRHIAVKYHFFKEHVKPGEIEIVKIDTKAQKADIFTKGLTTDTFESIRLILMGW